MNKGSKFIREIMATYDKDESQRLKLQSASTSSCSSELDLTLSDKTNEKQNKIIVRKKEKNFFNRIFQLKPSLKGNHIFKLYGASFSLSSLEQSTKKLSKTLITMNPFSTHFFHQE